MVSRLMVTNCMFNPSLSRKSIAPRTSRRASRFSSSNHTGRKRAYPSERKKPSGSSGRLRMCITQRIVINDLGMIKICDQFPCSGKVGAQQRVVVAQHDHVVAAAVGQGVVPILRDGDQAVGSRIDDAIVLQRGDVALNVLGGVTVGETLPTSTRSPPACLMLIRASPQQRQPVPGQSTEIFIARGFPRGWSTWKRGGGVDLARRPC